MHLSRFKIDFNTVTENKFTSMSAPDSWILRGSYFLVLMVLVSLSIYLFNLIGKKEDNLIIWMPPIEPPGSVIVTSNTFAPSAQHLARAQTSELTADNVSTDVPSRYLMLQDPTTEGKLDDLISALDNWSDAWRKQDMSNYLSAYAPEFEPAKSSSRQAWSKQRTARIMGKQFIHHEVRDLNVQLSHNKAIVKFTQVYADERLQQKEQKTMHLVFSNGRWLIVREVIQ